MFSRHAKSPAEARTLHVRKGVSGLRFLLQRLTALPGSHLPAVALLVAGAILSITACMLVRRLDTKRIEADFARRSNSIAASFEKVIDGRLGALDTLASFYLASDEVRRDEFNTFARSIMANVGGIQALEWAPRVADSERAARELAVRAEGFAKFCITERGPTDELIPALRRPEYFPVCFVEPLTGNGAALGYDLASDPTRRAVLERARDAGTTTASEWIKLVQDTEGEPAFLAFHPIYTNDAPRGTVPERRANLKGFVIAVFKISDMAHAATAGASHTNIKVAIEDRASQMVYVPRGEHTSRDNPGWPAAARNLAVADRDWILRIDPTPEYLAAQRSGHSRTVLAGGLGFTALMGLRLISSERHRRTIERSQAQLQNALAAMELAQRETALLDEVTRKINAGLALTDVLDYVFESFGAIIPFDRIACALIEDDGRTVRAHWARSRFGNLLLGSGYTAPLDGSSLMTVAQTGTPRIINQLEEYLASHPHSTSAQLIVEEGMRSSLTCPLVCNGKALGFLFFNSTAPRAYSEVHVQTFMRIANQLSQTVNRACLYDEMGAELAKSEERFALAIRGTDAGLWDWDVRTGRVYFSPRWKSMLGCEVDEIGDDFSEWERRLHPEDAERSKIAIQDYLEGRSPEYELEHRLLHKDGSYRWIIARGAAVRGSDGKPYRMVGSHIDVTARKLAEQSVHETDCQLKSAQDIQRLLLPKSPPQIPGLDIAGACYPSRFTAGDYFDYLALDDGSLVLVVADVMGHGFGPALLAASIHAYVRSLATTCHGIGQIATQLNRLLCSEMEDGRFVTLFLARISPGDRSLAYVSAGHPSGYILDASGMVKTTLRSGSLPLGVDSETAFCVNEGLILSPGDTLFLMTDGVIEAASATSEAFGIQRALGVVRDNRHRPAHQVIEAMRAAVAEFTHGNELLDDLTAIVVKAQSPAAGGARVGMMCGS